MARPLLPSDRLRRDPAAQAIALPDGRLLVRHAGGVSLLGGLPVADLESVLAQVDGQRTAEEVAAACADLDAQAVLRLLAALEGEMVHRVQPPPEPEEKTPAVLVIGGGGLALRIERELTRGSFTVRRAFPAADLTDTALVVCALEEVSYGEIFAVQEACLKAGVPALFVTADPDGLRIGPAAVPGVGPCFACAHLAAFGFTRVEPSAGLAAFAALRAGTADETQREWAAESVAAEVREVLRPGGVPSLAGALLLLPPGSSGPAARCLPLDRHPGCPLCAGMPAPPTEAAARAGRVIVAAQERRPLRAAPAGPDLLIRHVGIVGGGTAGYLAALALRRKVPGLAVTLIESQDVPVIGVGEATTPLMPQFLHVDLGLDIHTLFAEVQPTFKLGIRFLWGAPGTGDFNYPFGPLHLLEPLVYGDGLQACSLQSLLMVADAVGITLSEDGSAAWNGLGTETAYHLDNERFVAYLQRRAAEAGIERLEATIADVEAAEGEITALVTADGRRLAFDLYVDCTGFRSLLLERSLGSPWISFGKSLFTDRAIVGPVPHGGRVHPYTTAETMTAGWCWGTPQADADHRGYVYASAFLSDDEAEAEMRRANPGMGTARPVRFRAGRHEHFWDGNVVALGNAYGFVEPLESTALHMLIRQIGLLAGLFPLRRGERSLQPLLNRKVGGWWDYLRWFLALHYRFNRRLDTPFWRTCQEEVDVEQHAELLAAFRERGPLSYDPAVRNAFDYPDPLWGPEGIDALLLGQGVPCHLPRPLLPAGAWQARLAQARAVVARAAPHAIALQHLAIRPDLRERFAAAFRAAGPAFPAG
ncbi:MAG TPA: tryptophan halogenase family protein [Thermoanaerobaculia bacterium]|jgi:tryptophan halogenase|nr:tryptophan halogenase family protein [Thermoanaerobaculia bacterium]